MRNVGILSGYAKLYIFEKRNNKMEHFYENLQTEVVPKIKKHNKSICEENPTFHMHQTNITSYLNIK